MSGNCEKLHLQIVCFENVQDYIHTVLLYYGHI